MTKLRITIAIMFCGCLHSGVFFVRAQTANKEANRNTSPIHSEQALTKQQRIFGLVTIYAGAKQHFAYFEQVPDLDWDKTFMDFLPLVEKEQSLLGYYRTLQRFTALLQDGHTQVFLPKPVNKQLDRLPLTLDYIEDKWVVTKRWPTKEILKNDIPPGTIVLSIDDVDTAQYFEENMFPYIAHGTIQGKRDSIEWMHLFPKNKELKVKLTYLDKTIGTRIIRANRSSVNWTAELRQKYLPGLQKTEDFYKENLEGNFLYVRYRKCNQKCQEKFCELVESLQPPLPKAIIVDLRGNGGGSTPAQSVKHLISEPIRYYFFKTPCSISYIDAQIQLFRNQGSSQEEIVNTVIKPWSEVLPKTYTPGWLAITSAESKIEPSEKNYDGKVVILIDSKTGSAAEDMTVLLHAAGRATIIGEPSGGSTGQPMFYDLPGGGQVRICTANCRYPDGREFVGVGIQPDIPVKRTIRGIVEGQDEILEASIKYLNEGENR